MQHFKVSFVGMSNMQTRGYMHFKTTICATGHSMLNIFNAAFTFHSQSQCASVVPPEVTSLQSMASYPSSCQSGHLLKRTLFDFGFQRHSRKLSGGCLASHLDQTPVVLESTQCCQVPQKEVSLLENLFLTQTNDGFRKFDLEPSTLLASHIFRLLCYT